VTTRGLLIDSNLLLLLVVGRIAREFVGQHKRLEQFGPEDVDLLAEVVEDARIVVTTPNVWTEVSNLLRFRSEPLLHSELIWVLRSEIKVIEEKFILSRDVVDDYAFAELGLTDASLLLNLDNETTLLTIDAPLFEHALSRGRRAINFHHVREERGLT
jgi:hypothetical protein